MRAQRAAVHAADETAVESYGGADFKGGRLAAQPAKYAQVAPHVQKQAEEAAHFQAQAEAHAREAAEEAIFAKSKNMPLHKRIDADGRVMGADGSAPRMSVSNIVPRSERFKQEMAERKVVYNELLRSQVAAKEKREQATAERGAPPPPSRHDKITTPPILQAMFSRGTGGGESLIVTPQNLKCYAKENRRIDVKIGNVRAKQRWKDGQAKVGVISKLSAMLKTSKADGAGGGQKKGEVAAAQKVVAVAEAKTMREKMAARARGGPHRRASAKEAERAQLAALSIEKTTRQTILEGKSHLEQFEQHELDRIKLRQAADLLNLRIETKVRRNVSDQIKQAIST